MASPQISVIIPVYNASKYIKGAIESILHQTFTDFELIVIDDGSTDDSAAQIEEIKDARMHFYKQANAGMAATLNKGISVSKGKYIARQDADDISYPTRFEKQINFLNNHPSVGLLGTQAVITDQFGNKTGRFHKHGTENLKLKAILFFDNPFVHSSVMIRREVLEKTGLYDTAAHALLQDFDLWFKISQVSDISNLPELLQEYRQLPSGISHTSTDFSDLVALQNYKHLQQLTKDSAELKDFIFLYHKCFDKLNENSIRSALSVLEQIENGFATKYNIEQNKISEVFKVIQTQTKRSLLDYAIYKNNSNFLMKFISKVKRRLAYPKN